MSSKRFKFGRCSTCGQDALVSVPSAQCENCTRGKAPELAVVTAAPEPPPLPLPRCVSCGTETEVLSSAGLCFGCGLVALADEMAAEPSIPVATCEVCSAELRPDAAACHRCGYPGIAVVAPPSPPIPCELCHRDVPAGASACPHCSRLTKSFERLCPHCGKLVALTADVCGHCRTVIPVAVEYRSRRFQYVVCGRCPYERQLDDWFADRNLPFLFRTAQGVKLGAFKSVEVGVQVYHGTFNPHRWSLERCRIALEQDDAAPWQFTSGRVGLTFMGSLFPCPQCWSRAWDFSFGAAAWQVIMTKSPVVAGKSAQAAGWLGAKAWAGAKWWYKKANEQAKSSWAARSKAAQPKGGGKKGGK